MEIMNFYFSHLNIREILKCFYTKKNFFKKYAGHSKFHPKHGIMNSRRSCLAFHYLII